ncbi:uncharacterized protein LOC131598058 [Vicia villosa]|uniref:uncharacterized protein LOC131598058 n=1 Tax=Vicia villosa TaxID=3911 RepID=UPI00273BB043|nr:uncharacterized protein LOC131598058 [Vicia villosa]
MRRRISFTQRSNKVEVGFIQETKLTCFSEKLARSFWGSSDVEWTACNSEGASGGMVVLWKKDSLVVNYRLIGSGYVRINISWKGISVNLVNIYAPCSISLRRVLWKNLVDRRAKGLNEEWCLGGDFNEITRSEERLGGGANHNRKGMKDFREFIERMGVVNIPCVGGRFSWFKDNGKAMSRIDRFLVSNNLIEDWGVIDQRIGTRDVSDHASIRLFCSEFYWRPKPFRFNNAWLKHEDFKDFICKECASLKIEGRGDFILFEKLKQLKNRVRSWNREIFGWEDLKVSKEVEKINAMDLLIKEKFGDNVENLVLERKDATSEFWKHLHVKESMLRLKSRQLWLKEGDKNTRFFHNSIKERQRRNVILVVEGEEGRVEGVQEVKNEVKNNFEKYFNELDFGRAVPESMDFATLSDN